MALGFALASSMSAASEFLPKWIAVPDAKAVFRVAINGALLAFVWTGAKLPDSTLHWVNEGVRLCLVGSRADIAFASSFGCIPPDQA